MTTTETNTALAVRCVRRAAVDVADGTRRLRRPGRRRRRRRRRLPLRPLLQQIFLFRRRRRCMGMTCRQFLNRPCAVRAGAYGARSAVTRWTFSRAPTSGAAYRRPTCT